MKLLKELIEEPGFPLSDRRAIKRWLAAYRIVNGLVQPDLSVDVPGEVDISSMSVSQFPFQFGRVEGVFNCSNNKLRSLKGAPRFVGSHFMCAQNSLGSLEHAPEQVGGRFVCHGNSPGLLHNIHKYVKWIGAELEIDANINGHLLGVLKIKELSGVWIFVPQSLNHKLNAAIGIINKYLNTSRDIHACQEELLEAGLKEFAKL